MTFDLNRTRNVFERMITQLSRDNHSKRSPGRITMNILALAILVFLESVAVNAQGGFYFPDAIVKRLSVTSKDFNIFRNRLCLI